MVLIGNRTKLHRYFPPPAGLQALWPWLHPPRGHRRHVATGITFGTICILNIIVFSCKALCQASFLPLPLGLKFVARCRIKQKWDGIEARCWPAERPGTCSWNFGAWADAARSTWRINYISASLCKLTKTELKHNGANLHSPAPDDSDDHSLSPSKWRLPLEEDKAANVNATAYHAACHGLERCWGQETLWSHS